MNDIIDGSINAELLLDYEENGEFHLISATAAFMKRDLKIFCFCELWCRLMQSMRSDRPFEVLAQELAATGAIPKGNLFGRIPIQLQKQVVTFIWYMCNMEVIRFVVTQTKIGVWPGTGFEWQMVRAFSVQIFRLGILDYISRRSVYDFGKFPFGQTKTVLPFTSQPKFPEFFGKW